ncbi:semaphorin-2A-like [Amphiura filiformis]|uniref:semaphorin-2A-like n=1 Tax=Amphiura filiformis TaxID=82378 RepID=UPI003B227B2F
MHRVYTIIFFTSFVCYFGVMTEFLVPSEPFHKGGFGAEDYELPNTTENTEMKYRILHRVGDVFYIGGKGSFYRIDPHSSSCKLAYPKIEIGTCAASGGALPCADVAPINATVDCHNYIRIVEEYSVDGTTHKLLVCGTNALEPRCYTFTFDETTCDIQLDWPANGIGEENLCSDEASYDARGLAPRNWNLNYSYWYSDNSSSGGDTLLFTGVSKSTDETDPVWANHRVTTDNLGTDTSPFATHLDTYEIESRAVNEANFIVKPYEYTKDGSTFVLFFYRETAVEYINHGKIVYSRVGRVCRSDDGNSFKWSSFLKARLNCSLPDDYPAYFNEIQDMSIVEEGTDKTNFYAVFATPNNGVSTSALCRYRLTDIHDVFQNSKFKSPASAKSLWLPVNPTDVPNPRPGYDCNNPATDTAFIQNNPLMDNLVDNYNTHEEETKSDAPLFYTDSGGRFSTIAVDLRGNDDIDDNIYYIGTESGNVLKAYNTAYNGNYNSSGWTVFRYWQKENNEAITSLEFIPEVGGNGPWLFATTDNSLTRIDLKYRKAQNQEQYDTVYFPYLSGQTLDKATGVINSRTNMSEITTCDNRQLNLFCEGRLDETSGVGNITWFKGDEAVTKSELGHLLSQTHLTGSLSLHPASFLTVHALEGKTDGRYSCEVWYDAAPATKERVHYEIIVENCITEDSVETRRAEYENVSETAELRTSKFNGEQICLIENPILCSQSCPYQ